MWRCLIRISFRRRTAMSPPGIPANPECPPSAACLVPFRVRHVSEGNPIASCHANLLLSSHRTCGVSRLHPSFPVKTVPEFIAYAKADAGKINMADPHHMWLASCGLAGARPKKVGCIPPVTRHSSIRCRFIPCKRLKRLNNLSHVTSYPGTRRAIVHPNRRTIALLKPAVSRIVRCQAAGTLAVFARPVAIRYRAWPSVSSPRDHSKALIASSMRALALTFLGVRRCGNFIPRPAFELPTITGLVAGFSRATLQPFTWRLRGPISEQL
jgi:hypothetical protein